MVFKKSFFSSEKCPKCRSSNLNQDYTYLFIFLVALCFALITILWPLALLGLIFFIIWKLLDSFDKKAKK